MTLLVLPLVDLVGAAARAGRPAFSVLVGGFDAVLGFLLSFAVIARFWVAHHRLFTRVRVVTGPIMMVNLVWLLTVAVLPLPTEMVGVYGDDPFTLRFYVLVLALSAAALTTMTVLARCGAPPGAGPTDRHLRGSVSATAVLGLTLLLTVALPGLGYWALLLLAAESLVGAVLDRARRGS